jgi:hypothetical protein
MNERRASLLALWLPLAALACGSRSDLYSLETEAGGAGAAAGESGAGGSVGGGGDGGSAGKPCKPEGAICASDGECCAGQCQMGACATPPPPCLSDKEPVLLASGLTDPYSLGSDATSLFVGQLEKDMQLLRLPKVGGMPEVMLDHVSFVDYLVVQGGTVFYSDENSLSSVPVAGGMPSKLTGAFGPAGFAVTEQRVYLAEYFAKQLVQVDRSTLKASVLGMGFGGIYRVAATQDDVYFSTFTEGLKRHHLATGELTVIAPELGSPRAVRLFGDSIYFTVPSSQLVFRLKPGSDGPDPITDMSGLGVFIEALESDGEFLYTTIITGQGGPGLIARAPLTGGPAEVVTPGGGGQPSALVVDNGCVYWTERDSGSVFRARKAP